MLLEAIASNSDKHAGLLAELGHHLEGAQLKRWELSSAMEPRRNGKAYTLGDRHVGTNHVHTFLPD
jgi:hypothetical protein